MDLFTLATPLGAITLAARQEAILSLTLPGGTPPQGVYQETPILTQAAQQLQDYFAGARRTFSLNLAPEGTPFQQRVWAALTQIPWGETRSYAELARAVNSPRGFRAVGMANNKNPIPILIPCHRVIGSSGGLVGYGGGLPMKQALLELEGLAVSHGVS